MSSPVEQIKARLSIADVVGWYVKLERAGSNLKARCPFHNEKTPSFFVSPPRGTYYCFGCGAHGDIFSFVQEFEGLDFPGALRALAAKAGVVLVREDPSARTGRERLHAVLEEATSFFEKSLAADAAARAYLKKRAVTEGTIALWRIGFAPSGWRFLYDLLRSKSYSDAEMLKVGLIKESSRGEKPSDAASRYYDTFRGRIMFPIFDSGGRIIAFSGRILKEEKDVAKYLNSPETVLFSKSHVLYGLHAAKLDIRKRDYSILVEGQMDLILSHQAGFTNTVAASGTALSGETADNMNAVTNLGLLRRLSGNIIIAFDSDEAGFKASERAAKIALGLGMEVKIAAGPKGEDPADIILRDPEAWKTIIKNAKPVIDFYLEAAIRRGKDEQVLAKEVKGRVLPFIFSLRSQVDQSLYIGKVARSTGIREEALWNELKHLPDAPGTETRSGAPKSSVAERRGGRAAIERKLMGIAYWLEEKNDFQDEARKLREDLVAIAGKRRALELEAETSPVKNELIFQAELTYGGGDSLSRDLRELLANLEEEYTRDELAVAMRELYAAESSKDEKKVGTILARCQVLSERLTALRNKRHGVDKKDSNGKVQ